MFAVNTYEEIERREKEINKKHIVILLFVRPSLPNANDIINEFEYIHYNSGEYCSIYAVGYTNDYMLANYDKTYKETTSVDNSQWYFSNKAFVDFKNNLENRLKWEYSGNAELIILQSNPLGKSILNFQNYIPLDINYGLKEGYLDTFNKFMESLIRSSKKNSEVFPVSWELSNERIKIREVLAEAIDDCKKVPTPVRKILKNKLFFIPNSNKRMRINLSK